ncbi:alpha/beta hydrolase [Nocardiopsis xinjiangensis]|uniref:alpha/beta hydrolase n=1 Tax=Nocardiopsis xinjiangensis TaxID=124285 RepID=UPI0003463D9A|nr:alpha/beta hydrolase [Nocardiopsis xinjiangensis]
MASVEGITLDLPDPIEADTAKLRTGCDDLETLREDMLGQSDDTYTQTCASADKFTDLIAWDISSASGDELMAWEETSKALTHGAGVLRLWAEDIDTYLAERSSIETRWGEAKEAALKMEELNADPTYHMRRAAVQAVPGVIPTPLVNPVEELQEIREELRSEHATHWGTLMDQAEQLKSDLRNGPGKETLERMSEMGLLNGGELSIYGGQGLVPDDVKPWEDHPPHVVKAWWDSLSEEEREQAMEEDSNHLRDLDGIPAVVRDRLNREHLDDEISRVEGEIEELEEKRDDPDLSWPDSVDLENEIEELEDQRSRMNGLNSDLGESASDDDKYLLSFSVPSPAPGHQQGRLIVSEGNPDTADNVATLVPGTGHSWESGPGQMDRASDLRQSASTADPKADHAVISWIGYDPPQGAGAGAETSAVRGEEALGSFQGGLRATHEGTSPSHNTVIGHSYGSTLVGHAAQGDGGLDADGIALVGSPGADADHVSELGFRPEDAHTTTSKIDLLIRTTSGTVHGADPTGWGFGATELGSDWHSGHSDYFDKNTESWRNLGRIIAGEDINQ